MQLQNIARLAAELEHDIDRRVRRARFAHELARANVAWMQTELRRFWPFVACFSGWIDKRTQGLPFSFIRVPADERSHRKMWWDMATALGVDLEIPEPDPSLRDGVIALCEFVDNSLPGNAFAKFFGTEVFAVKLSKYLTTEPVFIDTLGKAATWFWAHAVDHPGLTHEDIFTMGAVAFSEKLDLEIFRHNALSTVDRFIELANSPPVEG